MEEKIEFWFDKTIAIKCTLEDHAINFEAFECSEVVSSRIIDGKIVKQPTYIEYELKGASSSDDVTKNIDEAQTLITGYIKFDGCSHVNFGDNDGYIHICGTENWTKIIETMCKIHELAREHFITKGNGWLWNKN